MFFACSFVVGLFATANPDSQFIGDSLLAWALVANLAASVTAMIVAFKRKPAIGEEMHKSFVPRSEYLEGIYRVHGRIDNTDAKLTKAFGDMERAIGRLEGISEREK